MTAAVRGNATFPAAGGVLIGRAVRAETWLDAAAGANSLLGLGGALVPAYCPFTTIAAAGTSAPRYYVKPRFQAVNLCWDVWARSTDGSGRTSRVRLHAPTGAGGYAEAHAESVRERMQRTRLFQVRAAQSSTPGEISLDVDAVDYQCLVESIRCVEIPRATLDPTGSDGGVNLATIAPRQPIIKGATGESIVAVGTAVQQASTEARRNSYFQWAVADADAFTTTSTTDVALFELGVPILGRPVYRDPATGLLVVTSTASWKVRAKCSDGTTTGQITVETTRGGAGVVLATIVISGTSYAWLGAPATFSVDADDLASTDGREGGGSPRWDDMTFKVKRTAGAGTISITGCSVYAG